MNERTSPPEPQPWIGGKLREVFDPYTKQRDHYAIEDESGVLWSGGEVEEEIARLRAKGE